MYAHRLVQVGDQIMILISRSLAPGIGQPKAVHLRQHECPQGNGGLLATGKLYAGITCNPLSRFSRTARSTGLTIWKLNPASCDRRLSSSFPQPVNATSVAL